MFRPIYPTPHTGGKLRAKDKKDWMGVKGDESRLVRCRFCGWICDPDRDLEVKDGSAAGRGVSYGAEQTASDYVIGGHKTISGETYYEPTGTGGCPCCGSYRYRGKE